MLTADRAYYLNADQTDVVAEGSPDAAFLLVAAGGQIAEAEAKKYGLRLGDQPAVDLATARADWVKPASPPKRGAGPSEDK